MARLSREHVFALTEIAICHIMSHVVRRCLLLGHDLVSVKISDRSKLWIEERLLLMSEVTPVLWQTASC